MTSAKIIVIDAMTSCFRIATSQCSNSQEDAYLLELVRYIPLHPLCARQVSPGKQLAHHPWCGHGLLLEYWDQVAGNR